MGPRRRRTETERVFVALGTNLGDRLLNLAEAVRRVGLIEEVRVVGHGPLVDTAPLLAPGDGLPQPRYLNTVIELEAGQTPRGLLEALLQVERGMGRVRTSRWGPRVIDLDLVLFGERVVDEPGLQLPHPGLASRRFVLEPLLALAGGLRHPVTGHPLRELLDGQGPC